MKTRIITTADGSKTIELIGLDEQYHSTHGALQESFHVYIQAGFNAVKKSTVRVLEIGFGTGLNCMATFVEMKKRSISVEYQGVEAFPVAKKELEELNYVSHFPSEYLSALNQILEADFGKKMFLENFNILKTNQKFEEFEPKKNSFDVIYYDAFGPSLQPELWTEKLFTTMYNALDTEGILVTYCAKGEVKRILKRVGFSVENLPGPPGKREITRARKGL